MLKIITTICLIILCQNILAEEFILNSEPKFIPDFGNRFAILGSVNPSMTKTNQIKNLHIAYGKRRSENQWWDFNFNLTSGFINKLTTNNFNATTLTSDQFAEPADSTQIGFGAGLLYETHYIQTLVPFQNMYELISASIEYNIFKNALSGKSFNGPGIIAKYSVLKKFNDYVSLGGSFIYNLAVVKRAQVSDTEDSSSRSLTLSHFTMGLDFSFYL